MSQICDNDCARVLNFRWDFDFRADLDNMVKVELNPDGLELESIA